MPAPHHAATLIALTALPLAACRTAATMPTAEEQPPAIQPGALWPDTDGTHINAQGGGVLYHDGAYYWFGEQRTQAGWGQGQGVAAYRSTDLVRWQNLGLVLGIDDDPNDELTPGTLFERPKVLFNQDTGRFVMWFHYEQADRGYEAARAAVAVADQPQGPYTFLRSFRPNPNQLPVNDDGQPRDDHDDHDAGRAIADRYFLRDQPGGQMARDMGLFVDDDGTAYHLYASEENATLHIAELTDDYTDHTGRFARALIYEWREAPCMLKHNDRYYLITSGCTGWAPNPAALHVADHPFGPWTALGNPWRGDPEQTAISFDTQGTDIFLRPDTAPGDPNRFVFMTDIWNPDNLLDSRYAWLPIHFNNDGTPYLEWTDAWTP